ncbi:MAG: PfkB family carbohydrate kinase [Candidatus Riflebacteria bacterium]|nr:PfkB family carbohydrate kinase [Candidatus Riflebacteria bacterium]
MSVKMTVVGSIAYDTLETPKGKREKALGGSAVYFSTVASYFTKVGLIGVAGKDFAPEHKEFLTNHGVDLSGFEINNGGNTFNWVGSYGEDFGDATTHSTCLNVFESFNPNLPEAYKNTEYLFLANIHPALQLQMIEKTINPKLIALDTMNLWINTTTDLLKQAIKKVNILFINQQEALMLSGEKKFANAVEKLLEMGPNRIVIKLGELGAMTATKDSRFFVPAFPCPDITDPTGAGDSFAGGFMGSLARHGNLTESGFRTSMLYGSAMGSITVENFSIESYYKLTNEKIEKRFEELKKMVTID